MKMKIVDRYEKQNTKIYYSTEPKSFFHRELCPHRSLELRLKTRRNIYVGSTSCQECEHFENINRFQKFINCEF